MPDLTAAVRSQLSRQLSLWQEAVAELTDPRDFAPDSQWRVVERDLGVPLRAYFQAVVDRLRAEPESIAAALGAARSSAALGAVRAQLYAFRERAFRVTTVLDLYGDAVVERVAGGQGPLLRGCDTLAERCAAQALEPLGHRVPPFFAYLDRGLGDVINAAGLRLYDGGPPNPVALLSVARDTLYAPTGVCHEAGHQVAAICGWNAELADALAAALPNQPRPLGAIWASWASEIAADAYGFASAGYASVAALHDLYPFKRADDAFILKPGDEHPAPYLRVLLGVEMCRRFYGAGPWDGLADAWLDANRLDGIPAELQEFHGRSARLLGRVVAATLEQPMRAFGGRPLAALVDPARASPPALAAFARTAGSALGSPRILWAEPLRVFALAGFRASTSAGAAAELTSVQVNLLARLGQLRQAASIPRAGLGAVADGMVG